jgi:hypothetical protein
MVADRAKGDGRRVSSFGSPSCPNSSWDHAPISRLPRARDSVRRKAASLKRPCGKLAGHSKLSAYHAGMPLGVTSSGSESFPRVGGE